MVNIEIWISAAINFLMKVYLTQYNLTTGSVYYFSRKAKQFVLKKEKRMKIKHNIKIKKQQQKNKKNSI